MSGLKGSEKGATLPFVQSPWRPDFAVSPIEHLRDRNRCRIVLSLGLKLALVCATLHLFLRWAGSRFISLPVIFDHPYTDCGSKYYSARISGDKVITPAVSALAAELIARGNVPGLSVGVVHAVGPGGFVDTEFGSWGIMSEDGRNVTEDTLFNIGSCSKAFLALSMGLLIDDFRMGRNITSLPPGVTEFTWDTRISDLLPEGEWALADEWATKEATVGDVLSHVTGLPRHDFAWKGEDSALDVVRSLRHLKMTHGLRMKWDYNNQMYILGSHIISTYAGMPYTMFAKGRIFDLLGMEATTFFPDEAGRSGNFSHAWTETGRRIPLWLNPNGTDFEMVAGPGGIISSAKDMTEWISALLRDVNDLGPGSSLQQIVSDVTEARAVMYGRSPAPGWSVQTYGFGWMRMTYRDHEVVWHSGSIPGFKAIVALLPRKKAGVVVLVNSDDYLAVHLRMALILLNSIIGLPLLPDLPEGGPSNVLHGVLPSSANAPGYSKADILEALQEDGSFLAADLMPLDAYTGTYTNVGYGNFTLCSPVADGAYCDGVREAFRRTHGDTLRPALLAEWPRVLATHMRLEPLPTSGVHFWLTPHFIFPQGYGRNTTAFDYELFPPGYAFLVECVLREDDNRKYEPVEGCGAFLTWESYTGKKPGLHVRQQADVWFERVY
ncbi:beta-lactamase/transpeptidase-like protein [Trametes cingulata]|nr:beta-lactamase/transpeptidase-like protein [Trametes cingulata]